MGLFSKKEPCPLCGGDVKGLFMVKIAGKKTLCKECSVRISMSEELLKTATPEFIRMHLNHRKRNAERYTTLHWDVEYTDVPGLRLGVDFTEKAIYLMHDKLRDKDNPVIFSFEQITGYELYRLNKKVDDADTPGDTSMDSGLTILSGIARMVNRDNSPDNDYFKLKLTTTEPYWPELVLKINFCANQLHGVVGLGGFDRELKEICQLLKRIVRREQADEVQL